MYNDLLGISDGTGEGLVTAYYTTGGRVACGAWRLASGLEREAWGMAWVSPLRLARRRTPALCAARQALAEASTPVPCALLRRLSLLWLPPLLLRLQWAGQ